MESIDSKMDIYHEAHEENHRIARVLQLESLRGSSGSSEDSREMTRLYLSSLVDCLESVGVPVEDTELGNSSYGDRVIEAELYAIT